MFVTKRNKNKEQFSVNKVKKVIAWAIGNLNLNPVVLESRFTDVMKDGITTDDIHQNLIHQARTLCTPQEPEWSVVAGRLETMRRWKVTKAYSKPYSEYLKQQIDRGIYKHPALSHYTNHELEQFNTVIQQERDLDHSYGSILTAEAKYLLDGECVQQMHLTNALIIASVEKTPKSRTLFANKLYHALAERKISLATPFLSNLRSHKSIASCFILQVDDSIDSIFDNVKNMALISKNGGGIGVDLSKIRAKGATIAGIKNASKGVTGWIKIMNDTMVAVDQNGKRVGSLTTHLPIWHNDIVDFLELQTENGDFRKKAFDIFPQVGIYDSFMEEVENPTGKGWYTFCPHEVKTVLGIELYGVYGKEFKVAYQKCIDAYNQMKLTLVNRYIAKDLLKTIMKVQFETGLPYLSFLDEINKHNPNKHIGYIPCTNLCTESFSVAKSDRYAHVCSLASIVIGRIKDLDELAYITQLTTHLLDNAIDIAEPPIKEGVAHTHDFRTIGIGIQGLHDWIAKNNLTWKSYDAITRVAEHIQYAAIEESAYLAKERGHYPYFVDSEWDNGNRIASFASQSVTDLDWQRLQELVSSYGIRNSQLFSPAPNTSTSVFMDASAGVMPVYAGFFNEDNKSGKFSVYGMYIKENPVAYEYTSSRQNQAELTQVVASLQKFVDTGISAEYIFDLNKEGASAKDLYDTIMAAWKNKTKAVYYIRSIKKGATIDTLLGGTAVCVSCSG